MVYKSECQGPSNWSTPFGKPVQLVGFIRCSSVSWFDKPFMTKTKIYKKKRSMCPHTEIILLINIEYDRSVLRKALFEFWNIFITLKMQMPFCSVNLYRERHPSQRECYPYMGDPMRWQTFQQIHSYNMI